MQGCQKPGGDLARDGREETEEGLELEVEAGAEETYVRTDHVHHEAAHEGRVGEDDKSHEQGQHVEHDATNEEEQEEDIYHVHLLTRAQRVVGSCC